MVVPLPGGAVSGVRPVLFGKLPRHGDFIARNLTPAAREAWDAWASGGLERAREHLGPGFEAAHDIAPPWRFVSGPGPFGPDWRAGAIAPSIDSAGRRFLIMLAGEGVDPAAGEVAAEAMESVIYQAFEQDLDADAAIDAAATALDRAAPAGEGASVSSERWWTLGGEGHAPRSIEGDPGELVLRMLTPDAVGATA